MSQAQHHPFCDLDFPMAPVDSDSLRFLLSSSSSSSGSSVGRSAVGGRSRGPFSSSRSILEVSLHCSLSTFDFRWALCFDYGIKNSSQMALAALCSLGFWDAHLITNKEEQTVYTNIPKRKRNKRTQRPHAHASQLTHKIRRRSHY